MTLTRGAAVMVLAVIGTWLYPLPASSGHFVPDLTLAGVLIVACSMSGERAVVLAGVAGLLEGALTAAPFGARALSLAVIAYGFHSVARSVHVGSVGVRAVLLCVAVLSAALIDGLVGRQLHAVFGIGSAHELGARVLTTCLCGLVLWSTIGSMPEERPAW